MTTTTATGRTVATSGAVRNGATLMAVAATLQLALPSDSLSDVP